MLFDIHVLLQEREDCKPVIVGDGMPGSLTFRLLNIILTTILTSALIFKPTHTVRRRQCVNPLHTLFRCDNMASAREQHRCPVTVTSVS